MIVYMVAATTSQLSALATVLLDEPWTELMHGAGGQLRPVTGTVEKESEAVGGWRKRP